MYFIDFMLLDRVYAAQTSQLYLYAYAYIYIYIYMCVCVRRCKVIVCTLRFTLVKAEWKGIEIELALGPCRAGQSWFTPILAYH